MRLNESFAHSLNIKKMRNDFIKSIMKDEEYKKKDDKKKEIVKSCKSYKDFCNIVDSVNMKPIRKYEEKVTYEDYINLNFGSNSKSEYLQEKKRKNNLNFMINQFKINNKKEKVLSLNDENYKSSEIKQFLNILKNNKENYYRFIKSNYNCDDVKYIICMIKDKMNILFENNYFNEENDVVDDENSQKKEYNSNLLNTINFLFYLSKHWSDEKFSIFFIEEELNDINFNIYTIIEEIKKKYNKNDEVIDKLNYIKSIFFK
ncbi:conserved Plasmodium protein, unknown function [Plasmodium relictum]|uniref:Dynein attachment factor N-terminal domain-containing protein n=1 Tax=Plasmodium relictum TaxID=85471 RepID=A0A1J1H3W1_PLARL|nr:conserved Plasmodium protein, unknown function [Plasmodium relictum]CRG99591.1 conserved Plasmodium protein, unknown function [Plasmodium relictum]